MDKTTNYPEMLLMLRHALDNLCAGRWTILSPAPPGSSPSRSAPAKCRLSSDPFYECHSHPYPELVQAYPKPAILRGTRRRLALEPNHLFFIEPHTIHAEHPRRPTQDYQLLWFVFQTPGVLIFINRYDARSRSYSSPEKFGAAGEQAQRITQLVDPQAPRSPLWPQELQARLIQLMVETNDQLCRPPAINFQQHMVEQIRHFIDQHYPQPFSIADLAAMVRCTPNHLNTVFRNYQRMPIHQYILEKRLTLAQQLLRQGNMQIKEVAFRCGFADPLYFSRLYRKKFGQPPTQHQT